MKLFTMSVLALCLLVSLAATGCETSHSEVETSGSGGYTKHETTTTENPVTGERTTTHEVQRVP